MNIYLNETNRENLLTHRNLGGETYALVEADKTNPSYQWVPSPNCLIKAISLWASHPN